MKFFLAVFWAILSSSVAHSEPICASWSDSDWNQYQTEFSTRIEGTDNPCSLTDDIQLMGTDCADHFIIPANFVRYCTHPKMDPDTFLAQQDHPGLSLPTEFQSGDIDDWKTYTEKFPHVEFDSNLGTHRVVFLDVQATYDRWILFFGGFLDIIVLDKATPDSPQIYFREFLNSGNGWQKRGPGAEACYGCHISGLRQIVPAKITDDYSSQNLKPFTDRMKSYGVAGYHGVLKREDYGPSVGGSLPAQYSCTNCHDGQTRGILNELDEPGQYGIKVKIDKTMPLNHPELTDDQRDEMVTEMLASYPKELKSWLEQL